MMIVKMMVSSRNMSLHWNYCRNRYDSRVAAVAVMMMMILETGRIQLGFDYPTALATLMQLVERLMLLEDRHFYQDGLGHCAAGSHDE